MEEIKKLNVFIQFEKDEIKVGELVEDDAIYFKFDSKFIKLGLNISPFKLPLNSEIQNVDSSVFEGIQGVFNDSIPDGWGRLLLDRKLLNHGVLPQEISPLTRLAYVGSNGAGALIYRPEITSNSTDNYTLLLDEIAFEMSQVYEGASAEVIDKLFNLGGSSGGARPKISIGYNRKSNKIIHGSNLLPENYEDWIIKFKSTTDLVDSANIEFAYHKMAIDCGITMSECRLFTGGSKKQYFGTKRFDRISGNRVHLHSASGLLHDDYRKSTMDYGHLMDCAFRLENAERAYQKILRLAAFNIYSHNRDDHSKNFAFLMDDQGLWKFAPAYDLTFSFSSHGLHSTTVAGESRIPGKKQLHKLAEIFGVKNINQIIDEVKTVCSNWNKYAKEAQVSVQSEKLIENKIEVLLRQ